MKQLDNLSIDEIGALLFELRLALGNKAARIYCECRSLCTTAEQLNVSQEIVTKLLYESEREPDQ